MFAGYKVPHPLENNIELKIQTDERSNPADALKRACTLLIQQTIEIKRQFMEQARNVELGVGAGDVGAQVGGVGHDPYGDGLGGVANGGGAGGQADIYDF
jgi:DNA-directed RNA polymerase II subunit RPB11